MSIESQPPPRMPQPEQWLSEHSAAWALLVAAFIFGIVALGMWVG